MGPGEYLVLRGADGGRRFASRINRAAERIGGRIADGIAGVANLLAAARHKFDRLTLPWAVMIGAVAVASALLIAPLIAPYRFQAAQLGGFWQFNAVTGEARICLADTRPFLVVCSDPYRPEQQTVDKIGREQ